MSSEAGSAGAALVDAGTDASIDANAGAAGEASTADAGTEVPDAATCAPATEAPDPTPATPCGAALCGNAQIDTCRDGDDQEPCDGTQFNGSTCASLGYVSGTLSCGPECFFVRTGCSDCAPSPEALACTHPVSGPSSPVSVDLANNGSELGLVWVSTAGVLHFERLGLDLHVIADSSCLPAANISGALVVATPSGWLIAALRDLFTNLTIISLDTSGAVRSSRDIPGFSFPTFVERSGSGPLLTYEKNNTGTSDSTELWAELLDAQGAAADPAFKLTDDASVLSAPSGVFLGDAFMLAVPRDPYEASPGFSLLRVTPDGQFTTVNNIGYATPAARGMTWDGQVVRLLRSGNLVDDAGTAHHSFFDRFDANGTQLAPSVPLPDSESAYWGPAVGMGADTVTLVTLGVGAFPQQVSLARLDAQGNVTLAPLLLNQAPELIEYAITAVGNDAYVATLSRDSESTFAALSGLSRITVEHVHPQ